MKRPDLIPEKIFTIPQILQKVVQWKIHNKTIGFTNGVFDLLHAGHIFSLSAAAKEADYLIIGLNADSSVKKLKGESRPINNQETRALLLASMVMVDAVVLFEEETPLELIRQIMPDVLIKGGDYRIDQIAGAEDVIAHGGRIVINPLLEGYSTTAIIQKAGKR